MEVDPFYGGAKVEKPSDGLWMDARSYGLERVDLGNTPVDDDAAIRSAIAAELLLQKHVPGIWVPCVESRGSSKDWVTDTSLASYLKFEGKAQGALVADYTSSVQRKTDDFLRTKLSAAQYAKLSVELRRQIHSVAKGKGKAEIEQARQVKVSFAETTVGIVSRLPQFKGCDGEFVLLQVVGLVARGVKIQDSKLEAKDVVEAYKLALDAAYPAGDSGIDAGLAVQLADATVSQVKTNARFDGRETGTVFYPYWIFTDRVRP